MQRCGMWQCPARLDDIGGRVRARGDRQAACRPDPRASQTRIESGDGESVAVLLIRLPRLALV